jgi:hypothetical protein
MIPPGGEGEITLSVNTRGYRHRIRKSARVNTNDPVLNVVELAVLAYVREAISLSPRYIFFEHPEGSPSTKVVEIKANLDKALTLEPAGSNLKTYVDYSLEEVSEGKRFRLRLSASPGQAKYYKGFIRFKTNYPEKPFVFIRIKGHFTAAPKKSG